jgi:hypothetical protein
MELKSRSFTSKEPHVAREPQVADPCSRGRGLSFCVAIHLLHRSLSITISTLSTACRSLCIFRTFVTALY